MYFEHLPTNAQFPRLYFKLENGVTVALLQTASLYWLTEQYLLLWQVATRPVTMPSINRCKGILIFLETGRNHSLKAHYLLSHPPTTPNISVIYS